MEKRGKNDPFELDTNQIKQLIDLAKFNATDIFYDLGSGKGKVEVIKRTGVKKAIGIEIERKYQKKEKGGIDLC